MKKFLVSFLAVFILAVLIVPQNSSAITVKELKEQIELLKQQIEALQKQLEIAKDNEPQEWCYDFNKNLKIGDRGNYVDALQLALRKEGFDVSSVGEKTWYFGQETASAVVKFQEKYADEILNPYRLKRGTGYVGRTTIAKLNKLYGCKDKFVPLPSVIKQPTYDKQPTYQQTWSERMKERWERFKERIREKVIKKKRGKTDKQGDHEFSLAHDGLTRKYKIHVPPQYDKKIPTAVVIYIHGGGGNTRSAYLDKIDKFSDKHNFILAVPEGTGEIKRGEMRANWNGGKWEGGECCGDADDVGFISKMIDKIKDQFNIDDKMIYATGISNGGLMTNRLACELSEKIAAIAPVAPAAVMSNCNPSRSVPVIDIHGTADPANPPDGSEPRGIFGPGGIMEMSYKRMTPYQVVDAWKKTNQCSDNQIDGFKNGDAKCVIYNECGGGAEVELCMVEGMGHTYPSGSQYLPAILVGPVSYDISFDQIWEFFKKHSMKAENN